jgi:hypothetical protein
MERGKGGEAEERSDDLLPNAQITPIRTALSFSLLTPRFSILFAQIDRLTPREISGWGPQDLHCTPSYLLPVSMQGSEESSFPDRSFAKNDHILDTNWTKCMFN